MQAERERLRERPGPGRGRGRWTPVSEAPPCHILLAEDDGPLRELLASALARDGYQITAVSDGVEMLDALGEAFLGGADVEFDLIVSDVRMPGWSGLQMLAGLHAARAHPPVVLITAFGDAAFHEQAGALGAAATLDKPFDVDDLRTLVCNLLARAPGSHA